MLSMFPNFRRRLSIRLNRAAIRVQDMRLALMRFGVRMTKDKDFVEKIEADALDAVEDISKIQTEHLHASVGRAISLWAVLEGLLVMMAGILLQTSRVRAGVVMYSILNFNVWLQVIDDLLAMDSKYSHLTPRWNKISKRLRTLKEMRDRIAHHTTYDEKAASSIVANLTLRPAVLDARQKSKKYQPLNVDQIGEFMYSINAVVLDLGELITGMLEAFEKHGPSLDICPEPVPDPPPP